MKLTFTGSWGDASTYTNSSGYFGINFSGIWTAWAYECDIHVYAENNMGKVINNSGTVYEYAQRLQIVHIILERMFSLFPEMMI